MRKVDNRAETMNSLQNPASMSVLGQISGITLNAADLTTLVTESLNFGNYLASELSRSLTLPQKESNYERVQPFSPAGRFPRSKNLFQRVRNVGVRPSLREPGACRSRSAHSQAPKLREMRPNLPQETLDKCGAGRGQSGGALPHHPNTPPLLIGNL
jgi:hypothetical protein